MSDTPTKDPRDELLVPDRRIVSIDEAKSAPPEKAKRYGAGRAGDYVTRREMKEEVMAGVGQGVLAVGQKMYEQVTEELHNHLIEMEKIIEARIVARLERRTLYGRFRALLIRFGAKEPVQLAPVVDAVEVLDPNVHARAEEEERRDVVREMAEP